MFFAKLLCPFTLSNIPDWLFAPIKVKKTKQKIKLNNIFILIKLTLLTPIKRNRKKDISAGAAQLAFALTKIASIKTIKNTGIEKTNNIF